MIANKEDGGGFTKFGDEFFAEWNVKSLVLGFWFGTF